jgi:hypothetical protein
MDESEPPIPPGELRLRSAVERTSAAIDPDSAALTNSGAFGGADRRSRAVQAEVHQNHPPDRASVAVYYGNEEEVREGFFTALRAMGIAVIEQLPEPARPPIRSAKP